MTDTPLAITEIRVAGFKSIEEASIEIRPLTVLAGANSSGKSSIMQPMLLMKQTLDASHDPGPLLLDGPHVRFTKYEQFLPRSVRANQHSLIVGYQFAYEESLNCIFNFQPEKDNQQKQITLSKMQVSSSDLNYEITPGMTEEQIIGVLPEYYSKRLPPSENEASENSEYLEFLRDMGWAIVPSRCFLHLSRYSKRHGFTYSNTPFPSDPIRWIPGEIAGLVHVPGLRGKTERVYPAVPAEGPKFSGTFEYYIAGLISRWQERRKDELFQVGRNLHSLGLTSWVRTKPVDDVNVELLVSRTLVNSNRYSEKNSVNIADVGFGVSQILPVLVALTVAEPDQLVYIEQPELHLHPRAQVELAKVLADAANRGVRIVIETHSSLLLQGILTLIAEEELPPDNVMLHWFQRNKKGKTSINSVSPDQNGVYGDWPVDFADVSLGIQGKYLDAVARNKFGN